MERLWFYNLLPTHLAPLYFHSAATLCSYTIGHEAPPPGNPQRLGGGGLDLDVVANIKAPRGGWGGGLMASLTLLALRP